MASGRSGWRRRRRVRRPAAGAAAAAGAASSRRVACRRWWREIGLIGVENDERHQNCDEDPAFHVCELPLWDRIEAVAAPRPATCETARREPGAANGTVSADGLGGIVGARRRESARRRQIGRNDHLIRANRDEERSGREAGAGLAWRGVAMRGRHGNRPQGWLKRASSISRRGTTTTSTPSAGL